MQMTRFKKELQEFQHAIDESNRIGQLTRAQCAVGDIVCVVESPLLYKPRRAYAIITHMPSDLVHICKIAYLDDLGDTPITALFSNIRKVTEEEL